MQELFTKMSDFVDSCRRPGEAYTVSFSGEDSDFVRFNHAAVRQAGHVRQCTLSIDWIRGKRHCTGSLNLGDTIEVDRGRTGELIARLRAGLDIVPEDPHLLVNDTPSSSTSGDTAHLPPTADMVDDILELSAGNDLVGILAAGPVAEGFAASTGQRNWFVRSSVLLDWSLYDRADKAVKAAYGDRRWDATRFAGILDEARTQLEVVRRPARTLSPGTYRTYLTPAAVSELLDLTTWGGFGAKSIRTRQSPLLRLVDGTSTLSPMVHLTEDTANGVAPDFQSQGFRRPPQVPLVLAGEFAECLVSPRSSMNYGTPTNGASASESPNSLDMGPGALPRSDVLRALGTGLYVSNLWYLNYSDRPACRMTGMTRFATFWVDQGEIVAPVNVLRFDDTLYRMMGTELEALTSERDLILNPSTYESRSTSSTRVPGALLSGMTFTL